MKVWLSPCPGVAHPGFKISQWHGWCRYLYRDLDGRCRKITLWHPGKDEVFER